MPWQRLWEKCRRDLWLYIALATAAVLCLLLGLGGSAPAGQTDEEARLARVLSAMEGGRENVLLRYDPELIIRESCMPPAQKENKENQTE